MNEGYCGKLCDECPEHVNARCPGCKDGPGRPWGGDCEISRCCRGKGHERCETCTLIGHCPLYMRRADAPRERERRNMAEEETRRRLEARAPVLAKWLNVLFWLVIPNIICQIIQNDNVLELWPALYWPGQVLSVLTSLAYALALFALRDQSGFYNGAATLSLVSLAMTVFSLFIAGGYPVIAALVTLAAAIISLVSMYREFMGHAEVLSGADYGLSDKWRGLWRWTMISFAVVIAGALLAVALASSYGLTLLFLLITLAGAIAMLVCSILKLVYLWRTSRVFRDIAAGVNKDAGE